MKLFIVQVMTAMAEPAEIPVLSRPVEPEGVMAAIKEETSLVEAFENNFEISQDVKPAASAASEETENREKPDDDEEDRQQDEEKESPPEGQQDEEKESPPEGQPTVDPPAAEPSSTETK
ncbi:cysteine-rich hydrophobic domain-containing protein 1-like, partial [Notothenia coriiceps]|uniref:Cysteine-rich hydrophobic domain-containing protein 1-like n=1 Tax=Notothenia coriiceps TaxID=8208 RepID=A0A6I9NJ12_9TELE